MAYSLPPLLCANYLAAFVVSTALVESHLTWQVSALTTVESVVVASVEELPHDASVTATATIAINCFMFYIWFLFT
jgi:hypothetical protein